MASVADELRIVLIGKTGNGKSSLGNSLLHSRTAFESMQSARSITRGCQKGTVCVYDNYGRQKQLLVVDTPGFFDTDPSMTNEKVQSRIASSIFEMTSPGVHAFLIVLRVDRFTPEEKQTVDFIKKIFGDGAAKYCIPVFTREDQLDEGQTIDQFINSTDDLKELIQTCGRRKFAINNKLSGSLLENKTKALIQMINEMVNNNNGTYYTNAEYKRIEEQRKAERERKEAEERRKKREEEERIAAKVREEEQRKAAQRERAAREEERQKAEKREREARDEERRKAEERERERRSQERSCSSPHYSCNTTGDDGGNNLLSFLRQLTLDNNASSGYTTPHAPERPSTREYMSPSFAEPQRPSGRFTGQYMSTSGSANRQPIMQGPRGGLYYQNSNGNKTYLRKN